MARKSVPRRAAYCWRVPGLQFREMPLSDLCCGSAGIYNVVQNDMAMAILEKKMEHVNATGAQSSPPPIPAACCNSKPARVSTATASASYI